MAPVTNGSAFAVVGMEPLVAQINQISRVVLTSVMTAGREACLTGPPVIAARAPTDQSATVLREIAARLTVPPETGISKATARPEPATVARAQTAHRETGLPETVISKAAV